MRWSSSGIDAGFGEYCRVENVDIIDCGQGIRMGRDGTVSDCRIRQCGSNGIELDVNGRVEDCVLGPDINGAAVFSVGPARVLRSRIFENDFGVQTMGNSEISDCEIVANRNNGIEVYERSTVLRNHCVSNGVPFGGSAVFAAGPDCRIEANTCEDNEFGIQVLSSNCTVRANRVLRSQFENYRFDPGNRNAFITSSSIGIGGAGGTIIRNCAVIANEAQDSFNGLLVLESGSIIDSTVDANLCFGGPSTMISAGNGTRVEGCTASNNQIDNATLAFGLGLGSGAVAINCVVRDLTGSASSLHAGIYALWESQVIDCVVTDCDRDGIVAGRDCIVRNNQSQSNTRYGIYATAYGNTLDGNWVNMNDTGMFLQGTNNLVVANRASANVTTNYSIAVGNAFGPIVNVAGAGDLSLVPNASHPLANLSY